MAKVEIYTSNTCPYCTRAKELLKSKGVSWTEYNITDDQAERERMLARSGGMRTVPQIFIDDKHIGGCDDLYALNARGGLDSLLAS